jgi:hypothetical protein
VIGRPVTASAWVGNYVTLIMKIVGNYLTADTSLHPRREVMRGRRRQVIAWPSPKPDRRLGPELFPGRLRQAEDATIPVRAGTTPEAEHATATLATSTDNGTGR